MKNEQATPLPLDSQIALRLDKALHDRLRELANGDDRSVNTYILRVLRAAVYG